MSKYQNAIDSVSRLKNLVGGLTDLAETLQQVESLENHIEELHSSKIKLVDDVAKVQEVLAFESDKYQKVQAQTEQMIADAEKQAQEHINQAKSQAEFIKLQAQIEVDKMSKKAEVDKEEFLSKYADAERALKALKEETEAQQARLDAINKEIERIKSL